MKARHDDTLGIEVLWSKELHYDEGADPDNDQPRHVRAGSGLTSFGDILVGVQDDADFLAFIEPNDMSVRGYALEAGHPDHKLYDDRDGTADASEKVDLEACVIVPWQDEVTILSLGSGTGEARERVILTHINGDSVKHQEFITHRLHQALGHHLEERGAKLNIEGAVLLPDGDTLRLLSRGDKGDNPIDASLELSWSELSRHLLNSDAVPGVTNFRTYQLGELCGRKLTFSDAEMLGPDNTLFTASSECDDGAGESLVGYLNEQEIVIATGSGFPVEGKLEGLSWLRAEPKRLFAIEDQDDFEKASRLYEIRLIGNWPS